MVNKVILMGYVGQDPVINNIGDVKNATFSLATSEKFTDKNGEKKEITDWHRIVCWRKQAELIEKYVQKGALLYIEGKLKQRSYEKDGSKHFVTEIYINEMRFLSKPGANSPSSNPNTIPAPTINDLPAGDGDDLPF